MQYQQPAVQAVQTPQAIEHQSELQPSAVGVGGAAGIAHSRGEPAMPAVPHTSEVPQQQLDLHRNSSGNSSNAVLAAERDPDAPSKGSMAALLQQASNPAVVTAAARLVCQLPPNVIEAALCSLQGLPAGVATLAIAYCMCRRGSGGRQAGADPRLDPTVDAAQAERILENRRLAAFSKFKSRVAALAAEAASLGLLTVAAAAPAAAAAAAAAAGTGTAVAMPFAIASASASGPALAAPLQAAGLRQHHTRAPHAGKPSAGAVLLAAFPKRSRPSGRGVKAGSKRGRPSARALQVAAGSFSQQMRGGLQPLRNLVTKEEPFVLLPPPAGLTSPASPAAGLHTSALGAVLLCPALAAAHAGMPHHGASGGGGGSSCNSPRLAGAAEGPAAAQVLGRLQQHDGSFAPAAAAAGASSQVLQQPWLAQASPQLPSFASSQEQLRVTDIVARDIYTRTSQGGATGLLSSGNSSDSMVSMVPAASGWHSPFVDTAAAAVGCGQSTAAAGGSWMDEQGVPPVPLSSLPPFCRSLSMLEGFDQVESLRELMGDDVFDLSML